MIPARAAWGEVNGYETRQRSVGESYNVRTYVRMYVCVFVCMYVRICTRTYVCIFSNSMQCKRMLVSMNVVNTGFPALAVSVAVLELIAAAITGFISYDDESNNESSQCNNSNARGIPNCTKLRRLSELQVPHVQRRHQSEA